MLSVRRCRPFYAFGAYMLGSAAASVGSTITIVGYAVAGVLTVASFIVVRRSLRRLEQRAEDAFPEVQAASGSTQEPWDVHAAAVRPPTASSRP